MDAFREPQEVFACGHVGPEASIGGPIALLKNGDVFDIDAKKGQRSMFAYLRKN